MNKVIENLSKIQKEIRVNKNNKNNFGNYQYRNIEDILQAVKPLLFDGVVLILSESIEKIDERYYVKTTAKITDGDFSIENSSLAREVTDKKGMDPAQITGASTSYARKYALGGLFLLDDNRDFDSMDNNTICKSPKISKKLRELSERYMEILRNGDNLAQHKHDIFVNAYFDEFKSLPESVNIEFLENLLRG